LEAGKLVTSFQAPYARVLHCTLFVKGLFMQRSLFVAPLTVVGVVAASVSVPACATRNFGDGPNTGEESATRNVSSVNLKLDPTKCDVVINGGTTAAFSAAIAAARGFGGHKPNVCLIEPTDWVGGQLTAQGVSAVDFPHHGPKLEFRSLANNNKEFFSMFANGVEKDVIVGGSKNPGGCSVSAYCNTPRYFLQKLQEMLEKHPNIQVYLNSVVKEVKSSGNKIEGITVIQRDSYAGRHDKPRLSAIWEDWYTFPLEVNAPVAEKAKEKFKKTVRTFQLKSGTSLNYVVFIDASETSDFLALGGAAYVQGPETSRDAYNSQLDVCGQAIVFPFAQNKTGNNVGDGYPLPADSSSFYSFTSNGKTFTKEYIFNYRKVGPDLTLQNWNPGNDYPFRNFYLTKATTAAQRADWKGGVDVKALAEAEAHALGWHRYFKSESGMKVGIEKQVMGTHNGLSKFPYIRDTRRSVAVDDFFIQDKDIWPETASSTQAKVAEDSIGIGLYVADIHSNAGCPAPNYLNDRVGDIAPFTLPLKAHTNKTYENLLVAGKNISQTYYVNSASRLQPIEWSSGWGAGVTAAFMWSLPASTKSVLATKTNIQKIQDEVRKTQPIRFCPGLGKGVDAAGKDLGCYSDSQGYKLVPE
jgi:hypothetical protein